MSTSLHKFQQLKIGDVCIVNPRKDISHVSADFISFVPMESASTDGQIDTSKKISLEKTKNYTLFKEGDILFAKITPCMENGKGGIAKGLLNGYGAGSTEFIVLRPDSSILSNKWLSLFLSQKSFRHECLSHTKGSAGQKRVPPSYIANCSIPIPSTGEQERIISKIEELFSEIDNAVSSLKAARRKIAAYRQAIYATSFAANHKHAPLSSLIEKPRYGTAKKCTSEKSDGSTIVYRIPNISYTSGHVDTSKIKYAHFSETEINKIDLRTNDLLFIRSNGSLSLVGRTAIITPQDINATFAGYLIRLRLREPSRIAAKFLHYYLESPPARSFIEDKAKSTNGINNISATEILKMPVPIYDTNAASQIVAKIDNCLSIIEQSERCIDKAMHAAEVLKQSILKKAFEGELS